MARLKDIAMKTGLSVTTVSLVLNNRVKPGKVSPHKRLEIMKTARELNYVPNAQARAMVTQKSRVIGLFSLHKAPLVVSDDLPVDINGELYNFGTFMGVQEACNQAEYHCLFSHVQSDDIEKFVQFKSLRNGSIDGVVFIGGINRDELAKLSSINRPCVHIGINIDPALGVECVSGDLNRAFEEVAHRFLEWGHRRVQLWMLKGPGGELHVNGFRSLKSTIPDLEPEAITVLNDPATVRDLAQAIARQTAPPTAFILGSPVYFDPFVRGMAEAGWLYPRDYSLVVLGVPGTHDALASFGGVGISTIEIPIREVGRRATRLLLSRLGELDPAIIARESCDVPCRIAYRGSCGPRT